MITSKKSDISGYGIFATEFIPKNTLILTSPYIECKYHDMFKYCIPSGKKLLLPTFGISLLNSSRNPNAYIVVSDVIQLFSLEDINKDSEIFIDYGI